MNLPKSWSVLSLPAVLVVAAILACAPAHAATSPLHNLVTEGNALDADLAGLTLTAADNCVPLNSASAAVAAFTSRIEEVTAGFSAPLTLNASSLTSLNSLSTLAVSMATRTAALSLDVKSIADVADMSDYQASLAAMLRLSQDIGAMADRILEMADKILLMADNIGAMADRIIITQELQNQNISLTQASILTTQQNALSLVNVMDTSAYNVDLQTLVNDGNLLAARLAAVVLNPFTLRTQMQRAADDIAAFAARVETLSCTIDTDSAASTYYINQESLLALGNMNVMLNSLGTVAQAYSVTINGIAPLTSKNALRNATRNLLSLSADIGIMSNSILEMSDLILAMADNIGLQADQILVTQQLQNVNIAATQASILSAQTVVIGLFVTFNL